MVSSSLILSADVTVEPIPEGIVIGMLVLSKLLHTSFAVVKLNTVE